MEEKREINSPTTTLNTLTFRMNKYFIPDAPIHWLGKSETKVDCQDKRRGKLDGSLGNN